MKFWTLRDLELYFDRSKTSIWALRKDPGFPVAIEVQGRQMFDAAAIKAWDVERKKLRRAKRAATPSQSRTVSK